MITNKSWRIVQHIPNFVDVGGRVAEVEFSSLEELYEISFVRRHTKNGKHNQDLRISHDPVFGCATLLCVSDEGYFWLVVGRIESVSKPLSELNGIPPFEAKFRKEPA